MGIYDRFINKFLKDHSKYVWIGNTPDGVCFVDKTTNPNMLLHLIATYASGYWTVSMQFNKATVRQAFTLTDKWEQQPAPIPGSEIMRYVRIGKKGWKKEIMPAPRTYFPLPPAY